MKKWSLMSLMSMPVFVSVLGLLVSMWSMSEKLLLCILVARVTVCKNPLLRIVS